jgi:hypothetical protein
MVVYAIIKTFALAKIKTFALAKIKKCGAGILFPYRLYFAFIV